MYAPSVSSQRSLQIGVGILAAGAAVLLLYYGRVFFITLIIAAIIAFLLEPLVELFMKLRIPRGLASFLVCSIALMALYFAGLGLYTEGQAMAADLPAYGARVNDLVDNASTRIEAFEQSVYRTVIPRRFQEGATPVPPPRPPETRGKRGRRNQPQIQEPPVIPAIQEVRIHTDPTPLVNYVYDYLKSFYSVLLMASFVPFLVYFILSWRDDLRVRFLAMIEGEGRYTAAKAMGGVADMVRAYVIGNFLLGIVLSVLSALFFAFLKIPYWTVVASLSGFLSLVPYIGLPLALIPPLAAALTVSSRPTLFLLLAAGVAILHLFGLNFLYPKLVGSRVHLNPLVVTVALMFWGMLWGGIGLLLAIPLTAGLKAVCDNVAGLEPYGRLLGD